METSELDVVIVGSNMVDLLSKIPRLPVMGETLVGTNFHLGFGGKGANQAVMAARLGAKVTMVTMVGDDLFGPLTINNFHEQGISTDYVMTAAQSGSGVAPILVDEEGRNMVVIVPGANLRLQPEDVRKAEGVITRAKILISQLEIRDETIAEGFSIARNAGVMTILNPAPARPVPHSILENCDLVVPNETEAELLTGVRVSGLEGAEEASRCLIEQGAKKVIITLGKDGALLYDVSGVHHFPAPTVRAVDTTGAGDAFIGGLAYGLSRNSHLPEAIRFANCCAALSVTKIGTQVSFPTLTEVQQIYSV